MCALVQAQQTALSKTLAAGLTAVGLSAGVDELVLPAVLFGRQDAETEGTLIGHEVGVHAGQVPFHIVLRRKAHPTARKSASNASVLHWPYYYAIHCPS